LMPVCSTHGSFFVLAFGRLLNHIARKQQTHLNAAVSIEYPHP
jgi:hypothetical protein